MDSSRTIQALTDCGAITAALKTEHYAIEDALQTLDVAVISGANAENLAGIMDIIIDFCEAHFRAEQKEFIDHGYPDAGVHEKAHAKILQRFRKAKSAILRGEIEGTLDAADLLDSFHAHVSKFDRAAHAFLLERSIGEGKGNRSQQQEELDQLYRVKAVGAK